MSDSNSKPALLIVMAVAICSSIFTSLATAQTQNELFRGCDDAEVLARPDTGSARDRILSAAGKQDNVSKRVFRSFSLEQANGLQTKEFESLCWSRLDGIWRQQLRVSFDKSVKPEGWSAEVPAMLEFSHGTYTSPVYINVHPVGDATKALAISSALGPGTPVQFSSSDGIRVADVLKHRAERKVYRSPRINGQQVDLVLDVTRSGYVRLRLGERTYLRPRPAISKAAREEQASSTDLFAIAYNPKNTRAIRQGYDITLQNPHRFLDNGGKLDVFARAQPRDYYVQEQTTVPLGLVLVEEGSQGSVFFERVRASESDYQKSTQSSFGVNAGLSSGGGKLEDGATAPTNSGSIGYANAKNEFSALSKSNSVSSITGYQRYKKFALVRDHPFSKLSAEFIDAIDDALGSGDYDRLIKDFGTHYAYAVTYGSAGHLTTLMTESSMRRNSGSFKQDSANVGLKLGPLDFSANMSSAKEVKMGSSTSTKFGQSTFTAVGGNGSWNENGFVAGDTPYPVLMDMRPLAELLNPMNFPGESEVYVGARKKFAAAISRYMAGKALQISTVSMLPDLSPKEPQQGPRKLVKSIPYVSPVLGLVRKGKISYFRTTHKRGVRKDRTRICFRNSTGQPKAMQWVNPRPPGVNNLVARTNGSSSCANITLNRRVKWAFMDRGTPVKSEAMNIGAVGGTLIEFIWVQDY